MVRFISIALLFALFFSLALPAAAAATYITDKHDVIDFLGSYNYNFYKGPFLDETKLFETKTIPYFYASGTDAYCITWQTDGSITSCSSIYLTILSTVAPSSVSFLNTFYGWNFIDLSYVGSAAGVNGLNRYFYRLDNVKLTSFQFSLKVTFSEQYIGFLAIENFYGYAANIYKVQELSYEIFRTYSGNNPYNESDGFTWFSIASAINTAYDWFHLDEFWWGEQPDIYEPPLTMDAYYTISFSDFDVLDQVYLRLVSISPSTEFSVSLVDDAGVVTMAVLDFTISSAVSYGYFNTSFASFDRYEYALVVDLSGFDLSQAKLQVFISCPYQISSSVEELSYAYCGVYDVAYSVPISERPWYAGIVDFFTNLFDVIAQLFGDLMLAIYDVLSSFYNDFLDWGERLIASISDTEEDQQEAEQFEQEANKSNQDLNDLSGKMDAVNRPDIDNINISVDSYIPADGITLLTSPFNIVFGNGYIFKILSVSLIMALVSYVLFGKR